MSYKQYRMHCTAQILQQYDEIGKAFLDLYTQDGFALLPPSSMLHDSVPLTFVMSAGLIQVENELDDIVHATGGKFAFTQPCFRHFDMQRVGADRSHLSFFHMSAAFHIGCTERETILSRLWYFLTQLLKLDIDRLWVTYLDDPEFGRDDASYQCWLALGVPESHLLGLNREHCFWRQRSLGRITSDGRKCGPHTEIFYERPDFACSLCKDSRHPRIDCTCGRMVEISNSLFIENYLDEKGSLISAETVFAECVVGLERLAMILQDSIDVYHIERFQTWREILGSFLPRALTAEEEESVNLILDHFSAFVKLVNEGAPPPGCGGRAYIMKKLARGALTERLILY